MHDIYKLKEMLCEELEEYGRKDEVTAGSLEVIDKLAHSIKNLQKIIDHYEEEEDGYSGMNRYADGGMDRYGRMGRDGYSYARGDGRGRGRGARRDSMGRYSSRGGYSMADESMKDMIDEMKGLINDMPEEKRMEMQKFIKKMEMM